MHSTSLPSLALRRVYAASPERVYAAWTDPELAPRVLCPGDMTIPSAAFDVRVGGAYRIEMRTPDGEAFVARGVYREVVPVRRLVMTWSWEEDDPAEEHESLLTLEFAPHGTGTELTLTHARLKDVASRDRHEHGWTSILDKLETL